MSSQNTYLSTIILLINCLIFVDTYARGRSSTTVGTVITTTSCSDTRFSRDIKEQYCYAAFGSLTMFLNGIIVVVLLKFATLRKRMFLFIALAFSDGLVGLAYLWSGLLRLHWYVFKGCSLLSDPVSVDWCLRYATFIAIYFGAMFLSASMEALISIERLLVIRFPFWFRRYDPIRRHIICVLIIVVLAALLVLLVFLFAKFEPIEVTDRIDNDCDVDTLARFPFTLLKYVYVVAVGTASSLLALVALLLFKLHINQNKKLLTTTAFTNQSPRRAVDASLSIWLIQQNSLTKTAVAVALSNMFLVVVPQFLMMLDDQLHLHPFTFFDHYGYYLALLHCINSCLNIGIYYISNAEFRHALFQFLTCNRILQNRSNVSRINDIARQY